MKTDYLNSIKKDHLPFLSLSSALLILGFLLFFHVSLSQHPPIYDAATYAQKAQNFWFFASQFNLFDRHTWVYLLDIEPTVRPPGTVLMSHPFGFSANPQGFFFRSIFLPVVLFVAALWIVAKPYCSTLKKQWVLITLCLALATLPMFYHFEPNPDLESPVYWGLVDNFLAAIAALATAFVIRGVSQASGVFTQLGIIASAFCLFIKPAGGLVMAAIFFVWALHIFVLHLARGAWQQNKRVRKYLILSIASYIFIYGITILLCLNSNYFSPENMEFGKRAMEVLQQEFFPDNWESLLIRQIHTSFGWHWVAFIFLTSTISFFISGKRAHKNHLKIGTVDLISAAGVMLLGIWFWFFATGQTQIRYFFPFALISLTICFPRLTAFWAAVPKRYFRIVIIPLLCPFLLVLLLLLSSNPSIPLQRIIGVNLTSGSHKNEVQQAKVLIEESRELGRDLTVYSLDNDFLSGLFGGVGAYEKKLQPDTKSFYIKYPIDWIRDSTFYFSEMIASDYLLFHPIENLAQVANLINTAEVPNFQSEGELLKAWLSIINQRSGLEYKSQTSLKLLKITDKQKFADALYQLKAKHTWRQVFLNANPNKWIDQVSSKILIAKGNKAFQNIQFSDEFVLLGVVPNQTQEDLEIDLVWKSLKKQPLKYFTLVHVLDAAGNILAQADYEQDVAKQVVDKGTLWHDVVKIPANKLEGAKTIGIGLYLPSGAVLTANQGPTDWDGKRLLIDIN